MKGKRAEGTWGPAEGSETRRIKPDKGGLRGIKSQNARIKGGNGWEMKGKRAEGTWGPAEGRKMQGIKPDKGGLRGIKRD